MSACVTDVHDHVEGKVVPCMSCLRTIQHVKIIMSWQVQMPKWVVARHVSTLRGEASDFSLRKLKASTKEK